MSQRPDRSSKPYHAGSDIPFLAVFITCGLAYIALIIAMIAADLLFTSVADFKEALSDPEIRFSIKLSLISVTLSAVLSLIVAVPIGYLLSRTNFFGKSVVDAILDIPIVLPPLVIGISLLILFSKTWAGEVVEDVTIWVIEITRFNDLIEWLGFKPIKRVVYDLPAVILSQFCVACAFAVRTMRVTFDQIDRRREDVALTLGCRRSQAFFRVVAPEAWHGMLSAFTLAWARSMGEFGPILVFAGATRMKTEVLPTTVFLELSIGDVEAAVAVSLIMVTAAMVVLVFARVFGIRGGIL